MNLRSRNLVAAGLAAIVLVMMVSRATPSTDPGPVVPAPASTTTSPSTTPPTPLKSSSTGATDGQERVGHAIEVARLDGLPPDATPGDVFDIWVAWGPPIAKRPNIQRLVEGVRLERIAAPVTPEGPYVAVLSVTKRDSTDLLYGSKYGALSVTQPAGSVGN